jgi:RNA-dependent RNA polymerase
MRTSTADLVKRVRADLTGDDWDDDYDCLLRSWVAWECSVSLDDVFGAKSFGWVALASIFEALKALEG